MNIFYDKIRVWNWNIQNENINNTNFMQVQLTCKDFLTYLQILSKHISPFLNT